MVDTVAQYEALVKQFLNQGMAPGDAKSKAAAIANSQRGTNPPITRSTGVAAPGSAAEEMINRLRASTAGALVSTQNPKTSAPITPEAGSYLEMLRGLRQPAGPQPTMMGTVMDMLMSKGLNANRGSFVDNSKTQLQPGKFTPAPAGSKRVVSPTNIGETISERKAQGAESGYPKDYEMNQPRSAYRLTGMNNEELADMAEPFQGSDDQLLSLISQTIGGGNSGVGGPGQLNEALIQGLMEYIKGGGDVTALIRQVTGR